MGWMTTVPESWGMRMAGWIKVLITVKISPDTAHSICKGRGINSNQITQKSRDYCGTVDSICIPWEFGLARSRKV
jgi:hypothetical protein